MSRRTVSRAFILLASFLTLAGCAGPLQRASASYKQKRDNPSLQVISEHLSVRMPRKVIEWLGPPDYSPTAGQDNYSAADSKRILVIEYREGDRPTDRVTKIESINVGE